MDWIIEDLQWKLERQNKTWQGLQAEQDDLDERWKKCESDISELKDNIARAEADKKKAVSKSQQKGSDSDQRKGEGELDDGDFVEWLERTNPALYRLTTIKYKWDPPEGTLEDAYEEYNAIRVHADALRQVISAFEASDDMGKWDAWTKKHIEHFMDIPKEQWPDDIWDAYNGGILDRRKPKRGLQLQNRVSVSDPARGRQEGRMSTWKWMEEPLERIRLNDGRMKTGMRSTLQLMGRTWNQNRKMDHIKYCSSVKTSSGCQKWMAFVKNSSWKWDMKCQKKVKNWVEDGEGVCCTGNTSRPWWNTEETGEGFRNLRTTSSVVENETEVRVEADE